MGFIKLVLKRPVTILIVVAGLIIFGIMSIFTVPVELVPDIENPMLIVTTVYPGAGPEDVDELVSKKIEDNVSTLSGLKNVSSNSKENLSMVMLELDYGTDLDVAHSDLQRKIDACIGELPNNVSDPVILEVGIDSMADITLSAWATGDINLYNFVDKNIIPQFEQLPGVASVDVAGGEEEYISIQLMDDRMKQYGLTWARFPPTSRMQTTLCLSAMRILGHRIWQCAAASVMTV
jgi:multidrug efflux pump subunit AcrB